MAGSPSRSPAVKTVLGAVAAAWLAAVGGGGVARAADSAGVPFLAVPLSVVQLGMGGTSVGHGPLEAWTNPALLAGLEGDGEVEVRGSSYLDQAASGVGAGAAWRAGQSVVVGVAGTYAAERFDQVDVVGDAMGTPFRHDDMAVGVTAAARAGFLRAGMTVKGLVDDLPNDTARAGALDLGAALDGEDASLLAAVRNLGPALRRGLPGGAGDQRLPSEFRLGATWAWPAARALAAVEVVAGPVDSVLNCGAAWSPSAWLTLRAGSTGATAADGRAFTGGVSCRYRAMTFDYTLTVHALGISDHAGLSFALGRAGG